MLCGALRSAIRRTAIGRQGGLSHASRSAALAALGSSSRSSSSSSRSALIKELRAITSAPMKECVKALKEAGDDLEAAVTILRKSGMAAAALGSQQLSRELELRGFSSTVRTRLRTSDPHLIVARLVDSTQSTCREPWHAGNLSI